MSTVQTLANITSMLTALSANSNPTQLASIASGVASIQADLGITGTVPPAGTTTTTAKITNLNLADASVSATGTGLFTPGIFTINGVSVTVNPNDSLATITAATQAALQAANHVNASAAATDTPGNFTLTVVDPSTNVGAGFAGAAMAGLTIPAVVIS